ncbi:MAG: WYL domain-containing protein [Firmicutes bacterium]|nr:WYL domain-containing protein [Bacillota bacterium]
MVSYNTSGMYEFMAWVLQWGEFMEVLEPEDLRRQMRERIEAAVGKYV